MEDQITPPICKFCVGRHRDILHRFLMGIQRIAVLHRPLIITATHMVDQFYCYVMLVQCDVMYRNVDTKICVWVVRYNRNQKVYQHVDLMKAARDMHT